MYMESRKMVLMNLFARKEWDTGIEDGLVDTVGEERVRQMEKVAQTYIHCCTAMWKIDSW